MSDNRTFVSYSRSDSQFAVKLASDLRANGASVWLDQLDIPAGARWDSAIEKALSDSARVIVVLSPKAVASQNVLDEVSFALDEGKTIVPVLVEACAIPMRLRRLQYVDFTPGYDVALGRLLVTLGVARSSVSRSATAASPPPSEPPTPAPEPPSPEPFESFGRAPASGPASGRLLLVGVALAVVVFVAVAVWMSQRGSSESPAKSDAAIETSPENSATAVPPVDAAANAPAPARGSATESESGLEQLRAVTRTFARSAQTELTAAEMERVADLESNACPGQGPSSQCAKDANDAVSAMFDALCARRFGPAPPAGSDTLLSLKYDSDMSLCKRPYMDLALKRMDKAGEGAIRRIKPG